MVSLPMVALAVAFGAAGSGPLPDPAAQTLELVRANDKEALPMARRATEQFPGDAKAWQILGILQLAAQDAAGAEASFVTALETGRGSKSSPTGLEDTVRPGTRVHQDLRLLKAAIALSAGEAEALNNLGATRLLLGRADAAAENLDQASRLAPAWDKPWLNGALVAIEREDHVLAEHDARQALNLGGSHVLTHAVIAEALFLLGRTDRAEDALKQALELDASYPYALLLKARLDSSQSRLRDSRRALAQALAAGPIVAADSRMTPIGVNASLLGGTAREGHVRLHESAFTPRWGAFRLTANLSREAVEARRAATQTAGVGGLTFASRFGTLHVDHYAVNGGKPGAIGPVPGPTPLPDADVRFEQTHALLLKPFQLGGSSTLWLHADFRRARVMLRTDDATPYVTSIDDRQWLGEARLDWAHGPRRKTQLGFAYGHLDRSGSGRRPLEPSEQIFPVGRSEMWTSYLLHRRELTDRVGMTLGLMAGAAGGDTHFQPQLDFALQASQQRTVHLRLTPRFNDSVSNLIPLDVVADSAQRDIVDRSELSTVLINRDPTLHGTGSRQLDFELTLTNGPQERHRMETVLFRRTLHDVNAQGADPRVATGLVLTSLENGTATGVEERATFSLPGPWSLRLLLRYQRTTADFTDATFDGEAFPSQVPIESDGMPNFPTFQGAASLDCARGRWNARLVGIYAGRRPTAVSTTVAGTPVTYVTMAPAQVTGHLLVSYRIARGGGVSVNVYNLGSANFYPGYPGEITAVMGYEARF